MGASSARYAVGWLEKGRLRHQVVEQVAHAPINGKWDLPLLSGLCHRAVAYAQENFEKSTLGIDTWGVDHGFIDSQGKPVQSPVAYRDDSHTRVFNRMVGSRKRLFELTGIHHQPFNTFYQLVARREEHPNWPQQVRWQLLPDFFGHELTTRLCYEYTQASTTQLMGLDGRWSEEAFNLAGWPVPMQQPRMPGRIVGPITAGVDLASVASHDTASAVCGLGTLGEEDVFLNIGTWTVLGTVIDHPLVSTTAENGGWTNERTHDGRVRFLKNIPGFYIVNRLHEELGVQDSKAEWLEKADFSFEGHFDYFHKDLYNPESMPASVLDLSSETQKRLEHWSAMALRSIASAMMGQPSALGELVGRQFTRIRLAGGGSQCTHLCQAIADGTGLQVVAGPVEATVLGNLGVQIVAAGEVAAQDLAAVIDESSETRTYEPGAGK